MQVSKRSSLSVFVAVSAVVTAAVAAQCVLLSRNNLAENGRWVSSKTRLEAGVMLAYMYINQPQALAKGRLNLGAWHGFQELVYKAPATIDSFSFDFFLERQAYLCLVLKNAANESAGVRLSASTRFPTAQFKAAPDGAFTEFTPLTNLRVVADRWNHVQLARKNGQTILRLNGLEQPVNIDLDRPLQAGFRGCLSTALVDNVLLYDQQGAKVLAETFSNRRHYGIIHLASLASVLAVMGLLAGALRLRNNPPREIAMAVCALNIGLAAAALLAYAYLYFTLARYPEVSDNDPFQVRVRQNDAREISERIESSHAIPRPPDMLRILIMGTSQTHGSGAAKKSEVFVEQLQDRLRQAMPDRTIECVRAGICGGRSNMLLENYRNSWIRLDPQWVILNLGVNDHINENFRDNLEEFVELNKSRGIKTLFSLEPVSVEHTPGQMSTHAIMREVALANEVPVVDVHTQLTKKYDTGFLWWDFVHPTSYGHGLIADELFNALRDQGLLPPDDSPPVHAVSYSPFSP